MTVKMATTFFLVFVSVASGCNQHGCCGCDSTGVVVTTGIHERCDSDYECNCVKANNGNYYGVCTASNTIEIPNGVDGGWSGWSEFGSCSTTCGYATKRRWRTCTAPAPANGGNMCSGSNVETIICNLESCDSCSCGVKKQGSRIVGGTESQANEYPWIVLLSMGCGGSVIADRWVLTAAHCFYNKNGEQIITDASTITIRLGEHHQEITSETDLTKNVTAKDIIIHDSYSPFSSDINDIALLKLPTAIDLNIYTPICLPPQGEDYTGKKVWVYGWGALSESHAENGIYSESLRDLEITVVSDEVAKSKLGGLSEVHLAAMVFAGGEEGEDACQGDSGGPLSYERNGQHEQVGVTSWGEGCGRHGKPGAYTELSAFRNWIYEKIGAANTC